ncbi:MAG: Tfp pilus assembly protein FimT/FimU [Agathobacter sp.]
MKNENMKKNNKGFSLVELIVVIAIMAVLMVVLAPAMLRYVEKTRVQKDDSAVSEVTHAVELALAQEDIYTEAGGNVVTLTVNDNTNSGAIAAASNPKLLQDVKNTVGDKIVPVSKARKNKQYTVKATYSDTRQAYTVTGSWN